MFPREVNPAVVITTNLFENTPFVHHNWVVADVAERVTIRFNNKEYSFVLDKDVPLVEVWTVNPITDELDYVEKIFDLSEPGNTQHSLEGPYPTAEDKMNDSVIEKELDENGETWTAPEPWETENPLTDWNPEQSDD